MSGRVDLSGWRRLVSPPVLFPDAGIPVPVSLTTANEQTLTQIRGQAYCALPWVEGQHRAGAELTAAQR